jgi:hypothetical protein
MLVMSEDITKILDDIRDRTQSFGAYLRAAEAAVAAKETEDDINKVMGEIPNSDDLKKQLLDGEVNVVIFTVFSLNELAFSDRVQNPEKDKMNDEFMTMMPTEYEILQEDIKRRLAEGKGLFDKDGDV